MATPLPRSLVRRFAREQHANAVQAQALIWRAVRNRPSADGRCVANINAFDDPPSTSGRRSVDCCGADAVGTGKVGDRFAVLASTPRFLRL